MKNNLEKAITDRFLTHTVRYIVPYEVQLHYQLIIQRTGLFSASATCLKRPESVQIETAEMSGYEEDRSTKSSVF